MDRRTYLKSTLLIGSLGAVSFSVFKWFAINKPVDVDFFKGREDLIAELAEIIIPETDTPGAKSAQVQHYIIGVLMNCMDVKIQNKFCEGIKELEAYSIDKFGNDFMNCNQDQKNSVFEHFSHHDGYSVKILNKINNKIFGEGFYQTLRKLTVEGYCMSKLGATQGLAYDYIPGEFNACIPLKNNQKSWATK